MNKIDWVAEHQRYMAVAYPATQKAARRAFWNWRENRRDEAIQECHSKMWDSWSRCLLHHGKNPETMIGSLLKFAILWVRYDRRIAGRARTPDVFDYRSGFKQQLLADDGQACPSDRAAPENWAINWEVQTGDNPLDLAIALEQTGVSLSQWCDM